MKQIKITKEDLESPIKGISVRLPDNLGKKIKSEASLLGITRDDLIKTLLLSGITNTDLETI